MMRRCRAIYSLRRVIVLLATVLLGFALLRPRYIPVDETIATGEQRLSNVTLSSADRRAVSVGCVPRVPPADYDLCMKYGLEECPAEEGQPCRLLPRMSGYRIRICYPRGKPFDNRSLRVQNRDLITPSSGPDPHCLPPSECHSSVLADASTQHIEFAQGLAPDDFITRLGQLVDRIYVLCGVGCDRDSTRRQVPAAWASRLVFFNGSAYDECLSIRGLPHFAVALQTHKGVVRDARVNGYRRVLVIEADNVWVPSKRLQPWSDGEWRRFVEFFDSGSWEFLRLAYNAYEYTRPYTARGTVRSCRSECRCEIEANTRWCTVRPGCDMRNAAAYVIHDGVFERFLASEKKTVDGKVFREFRHTLMLPLIAHQRKHTNYKEPSLRGRALGMQWRKVKDGYAEFIEACATGPGIRERIKHLHRNYYGIGKRLYTNASLIL